MKSNHFSRLMDWFHVATELGEIARSVATNMPLLRSSAWVKRHNINMALLRSFGARTNSVALDRTFLRNFGAVANSVLVMKFLPGFGEAAVKLQRSAMFIVTGFGNPKLRRSGIFVESKLENSELRRSDIVFNSTWLHATSDASERGSVTRSMSEYQGASGWFKRKLVCEVAAGHKPALR
jgi:hypothetical protein